MVVIFKYKTDDMYYETINSIVNHLKNNYDFYHHPQYHRYVENDVYHIGSFDMYGITYFVKVKDKRRCGMYKIAQVMIKNEHWRQSQKVLKEIKKIIKEVQQ